jgi:hypothetical protein
MDWGVPPGILQQRDPEITKQKLTEFVNNLDKPGWQYVDVQTLYRACGDGISICLFGRHMRQLGVARKKTRTQILYALKKQ